MLLLRRTEGPGRPKTSKWMQDAENIIFDTDCAAVRTVQRVSGPRTTFAYWMFLRLNVLALTLLLAALLRIKAEVTCLKSSWIHNCRMRTFQFQYVSIYLHLKRFERPRQVLRRLVQDPQLDAPEIQPHCCCRQDARLREESFCTSSSSFFFFFLFLCCRNCHRNEHWNLQV